MLRRTAALETFEARLRSRPIDYVRNVRIFDTLWDEARALGAIRSHPSRRDLDHDIQYVSALPASALLAAIARSLAEHPYMVIGGQAGSYMATPASPKTSILP